MRLFLLVFLFSGSVFAGDVQYCSNLKDQIEQVKQQQRYKSTQYLRDRYRHLFDLYAKDCMSGY